MRVMAVRCNLRNFVLSSISLLYRKSSDLIFAGRNEGNCFYGQVEASGVTKYRFMILLLPGIWTAIWTKFS